MMSLLLLAAAIEVGAPPAHSRIASPGFLPAGASTSHLGAPQPAGALTPPAAKRRRYLLVAGGLAIVVLLILGKSATVLAAAIGGATIIHSVRGMRQRRHRERAEAATGVYLGTLTADLRAGASLSQACARGAEVLAQDPAAPAEVTQAVATAAVVAQAGGSVAGPLAPLGPVAALCGVSERHGIPLADALDQARTQLDTSRRHREHTAASLQGPQATAIVLSLLPLAGIGMGTVMGARPVEFLTGTTLGNWLLITGVSLVCGGFLWSRTIIARAAGEDATHASA